MGVSVAFYYSGGMGFDLGRRVGSGRIRTHGAGFAGAVDGTQAGRYQPEAAATVSSNAMKSGSVKPGLPAAHARAAAGGRPTDRRRIGVAAGDVGGRGRVGLGLGGRQPDGQAEAGGDDDAGGDCGADVAGAAGHGGDADGIAASGAAGADGGDRGPDFGRTVATGGRRRRRVQRDAAGGMAQRAGEPTDACAAAGRNAAGDQGSGSDRNLSALPAGISSWTRW